MAYTITGRKCGTVRFEPETVGNIQTEQVSMSSKVTSNPIESGGDINDHVIKISTHAPAGGATGVAG